MVCVDENEKPVGKSADAMAVGFDLRTGEEKKRIVVPDLRSPEHHHRCYRNKATERYLISGMEGAEFMDLVGDNHGQNNWLRGACKLGVMPCNGLLYVPADQCFCQPGAKLLGFTAVAAQSPGREKPLPDDQRLERGPGVGTNRFEIQNPRSEISNPDPTTGPPSGTIRAGTVRRRPPSSRRSPLKWQAKLGGRLTAPVAAGGRVYVALADAHTIVALDAKTGEPVWKFVAGGRIDSPPTIHEGLVLFGSADGRVYCLRADDGELVWRFLAAPTGLPDRVL